MIGSVYVGKDIKTAKEVALKVERHEGFQSLYHEYQIYKDLVGCPGISRAYWYGIEGPYNVMVIDRYKLSLDSMVRQAALDPQTAASFASQMVSVSAQRFKELALTNLFSYTPWSLFMITATYTATSSQTTSWSELTIQYISLTSDWLNTFATPRTISTFLLPKATAL